MKIISTAQHARVDYIASLFFMVSPWIFGFSDSVPATWMMLGAGLISTVMSIFTNYEGGIVRSIPMRVHLTADVFLGALVASSPGIFGFAHEVFLPLLVMGLFEVMVSLVTSKHTAHEQPGPVVNS